MKAIKSWWQDITAKQRAWIVGSTLAVFLLGIISGDSAINIIIGAIGMFYVSVYSTGARGSFLLGVVYVSFYTVICLRNRIMLDAVQNIVLIPLYIYSYIYWGKNKVKPMNMRKKDAVLTLLSAFFCFGCLYALSKLMHGNYSGLDALNTTCTLYAMVLGLFGCSINWALWSINNLASAVTFGLCLGTPTGSIAVFAMKVIFFFNGLIGWYEWRKKGQNEVKL